MEGQLEMCVATSCSGLRWMQQDDWAVAIEVDLEGGSDVILWERRMRSERRDGVVWRACSMSFQRCWSDDDGLCWFLAAWWITRGRRSKKAVPFSFSLSRESWISWRQDWGAWTMESLVSGMDFAWGLKLRAFSSVVGDSVLSKDS